MDAAIARLRIPVAVVLAASLVGGCTSDPVPSPPAPPTIQAIGILAEEHIADPNRTYILADGRTFEVSIETTRVLFEGGAGQPLVLGTDASGPFVGVFSHQDGLPEDCHLAGTGPDAIERGAFIEIGDVLWRKASRFDPSSDLPAVGARYDGSNRFCFNDQAEVAYIVR